MSQNKDDQPGKRPHIILFNPDQWRGDVVGHLGNQAAATPTLDRLIEDEAVSFSQAYCQNPVCTPSRCSFMTGWYPHVRGHRTMFHMLKPDEPMLLKTLKDDGYCVWWGGKNDVVPAQNGFDAYCDIKYRPEEPTQPSWGRMKEKDWRGQPDDDTYYSFYVGRPKKAEGEAGIFDHDEAMVQGAIDFIKQAPKDQPLCVYLPLQFPHPPYVVDEPWYSMIDAEMIPERIPSPEGWEGKPSILKGISQNQRLQGWSEERWRELRATYYGMCTRVDDLFGRLLAALREVEIYDDTAIFFFSDHGDFTGDYGLVEKTQNTFEDCLTHVPFVVKPPANIPVKPGVRNAMVELIDMPATVEALTGIPVRHTHFGRSLLPLLADENAPGRDAVFCEGGRLAGEEQAKELESVANQSPEGLYWPRVALQHGDGPEHTKAVMCRTTDFKYVRRLYESDELYDLRTDPHELHNRINDPEMAAVLATLKDRLLTFYQETGDVVPFETDKR